MQTKTNQFKYQEGVFNCIVIKLLLCIQMWTIDMISFQVCPLKVYSVVSGT